MKTTEFRQTANKTFLRVTYGMQKHGSQEPYFSITADEYSRPIAKERYWQGGGLLHDAIRATFPELAYLTTWHLCFPASGPVHYLANSLFWFDAYHGTGKYTKPEDKDSAPDALTAAAVLGALPGDESSDTLLAMSRSDAEAYLVARLPALIEAFNRDMATL